ncbi:MAG TPA: HAMP domain-containing sensor histidine kinase [Candidatus Paceibacterota bacterium]
MSLFSSKKFHLEKEKLDIITENMREGAILLSDARKIIFINPAARVFLDIGKTEKGSDAILRAFQKKFPSVSVDQCVVHAKPNNPFHISEVESNQDIYEIRFSCIVDGGKKKTRNFVLIWIEDITETKMLERRKSEFVSVVAHQLRTPLSGLKWTLHMLINGDFGKMSDEQRTFLMKSYENNERMITLVNDMLAADRIESGRMKYNLLRINFRDLVENVLFEVFPSAQRRGVKIDFDCPIEGKFIALVDPSKIRAVVQNLLENAIKYTMQGGTITIKLQFAGTDVKISIKDSGIGIPKAQQGQIFTRFFRAGNAVKVEPSGSGLGLYMVKKIVEQHGGKVWFTSAEHGGSTFFVTIPLISETTTKKKIL